MAQRSGCGSAADGGSNSGSMWSANGVGEVAFPGSNKKGQASRAARRVAAIRAPRLAENKDVEMEDNVEFIGVIINLD